MIWSQRAKKETAITKLSSSIQFMISNMFSICHFSTEAEIIITGDLLMKNKILHGHKTPDQLFHSHVYFNIDDILLALTKQLILSA